MASLAYIEPDLRDLDDAPGDLLIVSAFSDDRPLTGLTGLVDWRLGGAMSRWRQGGFSNGTLGERVLYAAGRRLSHPRVLLMGLGLKAEHRADRAFAAARSAISCAIGLGATRITTGFFGLQYLPSPLERTSLKLIELLTAPDALELCTLVADARKRELIRDGIAIHGSPGRQ